MVHSSQEPRSRRVTLPATAALLAATALSACGLLSLADSARLHQQAQAALGRWADAVGAAGGQGIVLVGEPTGQIGNWEDAVGDNNKQALYAGLVEGEGMPADAPPAGEVRWPDGRTASVPVISAQQAVADIRAGASAPCAACTPMRITGAQLTNGPIQTGTGPATGPTWVFTLQGTAVKVTRVAIGNAISVVPPVSAGNDAPIGLSIESATGTVGGSELTVSFTGAPKTGDQTCGADYTAEAVESTLAVVIIVTAHPNAVAASCTDEGATRTASVQLAAPLADRAVLEVQQGLPVPVELTP